MVQIRFKLENCTVSDDAQVWFLYTGAEETVDSITSGQIVKQAFPTDYQVGDYVVLTFRNLPVGYSTLGLLTSFRLHFYNITAGADGKLIFDTIYIGNEANAPGNAPLYFDFGGSATELYRYTDASYGSGAYNFAAPNYWAYHANQTEAFDLSDGILSFTVSSDEAWGSSSWLRPSNGKGSNTAFLLNLNRSNIEVVQLRLRITGTLRDNSDIVLYLSKETNKFVTLAVAPRELLRTGEYYILNLPLRGSPSHEWYGLFSLDTHNMQGCKLEIDYLYIGNQANAPRTEGLHMDFTNSMSDVYRYNLPQYLSFNYDDSYQWAANLSRSSRPVVNAQSGCIEYRLKDTQTWLRPSIGKNDSQNQSLSYKPSANDVLQIHFRADGFTGTSGTLRPSFTDGTKQSNGWYTFQKLTEEISIQPKDGQFITLTLPLTDIAKATTIHGITLDFYNMTGCELFIDSIYIGPADSVPCCTSTHKPISTNVKAPSCTENGYSGDSYCELCDHQTAKGLVLERTAHTYSYTCLDYSHKALCNLCNEALWEPHWYGNEGLCRCGAKEADKPADYLFMGFENDAEAQGRYNSYSYCGYNYDTSTCWGYNNLRTTAPTVNTLEESLSFQVIDTTSWVRPSLSKRSVGYTNLYFPTSKIDVFQIRLKLLRETVNTAESIQLSYTTGTYNPSNGNPIYSTVKSFTTAEVNAIPNGEYVTLTVPLTDYKFTWDTMRGYNLNFNGVKNTTVTCENCNHSEEVPHSYTDGKCICGQIEIKEPIEVSTWKLGHSLNLASDISVNYAIAKASLTGFDKDTIYILVELDVYEGSTKTGVKTFKLLPTEQGDYYYFTLNGLTAVNMNDEIRAVLYAAKDGQVHYSPVDDYSIATYAYAQMNKATAPQKLKNLCAELLRYGGKAQSYKSYRLDALADDNMTEVRRAYLSDIDAVTFGSTNNTLSDLESPLIKWQGKALDLASKVTIKFIFSMGSYTGDISDLSLRVSYEDINGNSKTMTLNNGELYNSKYQFYAFTLDSLLAAELRCVLSVQIYAGDTPISCTMEYAADTYGNNKTGALGELCKALFAYSDSAKVYFAK